MTIRLPVRNLCSLTLCASLFATTSPSAAFAATEDTPAPVIDSTFQFKHPGTLSSLGELTEVKERIAAGREPWKSSFDKLKGSLFARLTWTAKPVADPYSGINGAGDAGALQEIRDSAAAQTQALLWVLTGDKRYAENSGKIMDAWSAVLKDHTGKNWYLNTAWSGCNWAEAGDLLHATYPDWQGAPQLQKMLNDVFLPVLHNRMAFGNREFAVCHAMAAIGVFNDDPAAFAEAIDHVATYTPEYFYITDDGPTPRTTDYWITSPTGDQLKSMEAGRLPKDWTSWIDQAKDVKNLGDDRTGLTRGSTDGLWKHPGAYLNGYCPETGGRDVAHAEAAFGSAIATMEIAWHQGIDLYKPNAKRLAAFMETTTAIRLGEPISKAAYGGVLNPGNGLGCTYETAYNHLHNILGLDLPTTHQYILAVSRNMKADSYYQAPFPPIFPPNLFGSRIWGQCGWSGGWETLTHGDLNAP